MKPSELVVLLGKEKKEKEMQEPEETQEVSGKDQAISEIFDALKANDKKAFGEAFQAFYDMCGEGEDE